MVAEGDPGRGPSTEVAEIAGGTVYNLPAQLSGFVGRQRELREVTAALADAGVVTLTGPGGCGKTRLALQAATEARSRFPDGVWWVELARFSDADLVGAAVAQALGVRPLPGQAELDAAVGHLASRRALVVLDNCEHLLNAVRSMAQTLAASCPHLTLLATSREALQVNGETRWEVPPLSLPRVEDGPDAAGESDAVRLFLARAGEVRPAGAPAPSQVAALCRDLHGMPLAIELAAGRLRALTIGQIIEGLADALWLLAGASPTPLARHQSLRASVDWSHSLLTDAERALFRRLGVFVGGFTLDAAERVGAGDDLNAKHVLDLLSGLIDKSLVQAEEHGPLMCYRLLEPIRQYAMERLEEAGEVGPARDRHRDHYLEVAERAGAELLTPRLAELLDLLEPDAANFDQAIGWATATDPDKALRLCVALTWWYRLRGHFAQGDHDFRRALEVTGPDPAPLRARGLFGRAHLLTYAGAFAEALPATTETLAVAEQAGEESALAGSLFLLGMLTHYPDPVGARVPLERGLELTRGREEHRFWFMAITQMLAYTYVMQDDIARAVSLVEEVLPIVEQLGYHESLAWHWGVVAFSRYIAQGPTSAFHDAVTRALEASRTIVDVVTEGIGTSYLAWAELGGGDADTAVERLLSVRGQAMLRGGAVLVPFIDLFIGMAQAAGGRLDPARQTLEAVVTMTTDTVVYAESWARIVLAEALRLLGDPVGAGEHARRALEVAERSQNRRRQAEARLMLGRLAVGRQAWSEAQQLLHEALAGMLDSGYRIGVPDVLDGLAQVATGLGRDAEAARLVGAAARARGDLGLVAWPGQREETERLRARLADALGDGDAAKALAEGEELPLDAAVAYVRRARGSRRRPSHGWESLTPTELEVVAHAAEGLTNPQIAERMFITAGTVKTHLASIYAKLQLKNRSELAAAATARQVRPGGA